MISIEIYVEGVELLSPLHASEINNDKSSRSNATNRISVNSMFYAKPSVYFNDF